MRYVGVDLHKRTLSVCVMAREEGRRVVLARKTLRCSDMEGIREFLEVQSPCRIVLEATSSYEWFVALTEPIAERVVLAHPTKMRVIAESTRKTDKLDAQVLGVRSVNCLLAGAVNFGGFPSRSTAWREDNVIRHSNGGGGSEWRNGRRAD